MYYFS